MTGTGHDPDATESSRRQFLKATGVGAVAATSAGCNSRELTTRTFEATPFAIGGRGMRQLGFEEHHHETTEETRRVSAAGVEAELTLTSHVVSYGRDATVPEETSWRAMPGGTWSAGVLSTPAATVAGEPRNPLATRPLPELLVGDAAERFLPAVGVDAAEWAVPPERLGSETGEVLGRETEVAVHLGVADVGGVPTAVAVYGTRVLADDEAGSAVVAGAVDRRRLPDDVATRDCRDDLSECLPEDDRGLVVGRLTDLLGVLDDLGPLADVPLPGDLPAVPSLALEDARLVQICEDSDLPSGSAGPISDPPIVQNQRAAPLFGVSGRKLDPLPSYGIWAEVTVTKPDGSTEYDAFRLPRDVLADVAGGDDPAAKFHELARDGFVDTNPPVFYTEYDAVRIRLVPVGGGTPYDTTSWSVDTARVPPLKVGFVHVKDPGKGHIDWGDANGEAKNYVRSANSFFAYISRVFPGPVVAYRHDPPMEANVRERKGNDVARDARDARIALNKVVGNRQNYPPTNPANGEVYADGVGLKTGADLVDRKGLDVVAMILPKGTTSGHTDYYAAHGRPGTWGLYQGTKFAVGVLEARTGNTDEGASANAAQEIGHYFATLPYDDGRNDPFAQGGSDEAHATGALRSVGYSLDGRTFSLVQDHELIDGRFDPDSSSKNGSGTHTSYMSYVGPNRWADNRITSVLINSNYGNRFSGGSSPAVRRTDGAATGVTGAAAGATDSTASGDDGTAAASATGQDQEAAGPVLEAFGRVEDGAVTFDRSAVFDGTPLDTPDVDVERRLAANEAEPVEVTLLGPESEALRSTVVPDRLTPSHGDAVDAVAVSLPFDERGVRLRADYGGRETTLNAIVHPLRDAVRRVPERGFEGDGGREQLLAVLDGVAAAMDEGRYGQAAETLAGEFQPAVGDFEPLAGETTVERLLALAERQAGRLAGIAG